jgi:hypothetical protein
MSGFKVTINYDSDTQKALNGHYTLLGFKAVKSSALDGVPLVWFGQTSFLGDHVTISWSESYQAYISTDQIISGGDISTSDTVNVTVGELALVDGTGNMSVSAGPDKFGITISNGSSTPYTCGISQLQGNSMKQLCAFPLHGNQADDITPIEKVLLFFGTKPLNTGTVIETTVTQGVLLDLTDQPEVALNYHIDGGFDAQGANWATLVPAASNMGPLLILSSNSVPAKLAA